MTRATMTRVWLVTLSVMITVPGVVSAQWPAGRGNYWAKVSTFYHQTTESFRSNGDKRTLINADAENSLVGVWEHTARASGAGADGMWVFEMSRPLQTGDPEDVQFVSGGTALIALAYFDADETSDGWTDTGHLQSADAGWIEVTIP